MNVVAFAPRQLQQDGIWRTCELDQIRMTFAAELANGSASGWHVGATERGDPQFYLIGPAPEENCILSISRLGRLYVLEDGAGYVEFEHTDLKRLTERAKKFLHGTGAGLIASFAMMWGGDPPHV
jgi:hypothetical protein